MTDHKIFLQKVTVITKIYCPYIESVARRISIVKSQEVLSLNLTNQFSQPKICA